MADDRKKFGLVTILSAGPQEAYDTFSREIPFFVCVCIIRSLLFRHNLQDLIRLNRLITKKPLVSLKIDDVTKGARSFVPYR